MSNSYSETINELVEYLNTCRDEYYNNNNSLISDKQYDELFDKLVELEKESGIVLSNSPTQNVGYEIKKGLDKVEHKKPLLSLDKAKDFNKVLKFCGGDCVLFMHKLDGITCQLTYIDGKLTLAATRGNGVVGEDITHNAQTFLGIPKTIPIMGEIKITGEAIITRKDFAYLNAQLDNAYKTPRNLASGSATNFNNEICARRKVRFIAWNANDLSDDDSVYSGLIKAQKLGFNIVHTVVPRGTLTESKIENIFNNMKDRADKDYLPIDCIVILYDSISYCNSFGRTSHHFKNGLAYKFYEERKDSILRDVEFTIGKTGVLTPTAIFDSVDIDGTDVSRASVHNISILRKLNLCVGDHIEIYKANEIIPQIHCNIDIHEDQNAFTSLVPDKCPYCGSPTKAEKSSASDTVNLYCTNKQCRGVILKKLSAFVSRNAINIDGLSDKTLEKFIDLGYVKTYSDIFTEIEKHKYEISKLPGFGEKSVESLIESINKSKNTTLDKLFIAFNIEGVGKQVANDLAKFFEYDVNKTTKDFKTVEANSRLYDSLLDIDGFGNVLCDSICIWFASEDHDEYCDLIKILNVAKPVSKTDTKLSGMNFVITGKLNNFSSRDDLIKTITDNGGVVQGSVTKNTTYLINNDTTSNSTKNQKAKSLNVSIISEDEFLSLIDGDKPIQKPTPVRRGFF